MGNWNAAVLIVRFPYSMTVMSWSGRDSGSIWGSQGGQGGEETIDCSTRWRPTPGTGT